MTFATQSTTDSTTEPRDSRTQHGWSRAAIVAGTTGALIVFAAIFAVGFGEVVFAPTFDDAPPTNVGVGAVAAATLLAICAGWGLLALLERWTQRPRVIWTASAVVLAIASLLPLVSGVATAGDRAALAVLHLLVAAIYIPSMSRTAVGHSGDRR